MVYVYEDTVQNVMRSRLMAFGTVPLVTSDVNTSSYMEPLVENIHYIK